MNTYILLSYPAHFFRMWNISDKLCRENHSTHFVFGGKLCILWDNVEKYGRDGQITDNNMTQAHFMMDT